MGNSKDFKNVNIKAFCAKSESKNGKSQCFMVKDGNTNKFFWVPKNCVHVAAYSLGYRDDFTFTVYELDDNGERKNEKELTGDELASWLGQCQVVSQ